MSQFAFRLHERFTYEYNFFDAWLLDVRFEGERAFDPKRRYPRCVMGARKARHVDRKLRDIAVLLQYPLLTMSPSGRVRVRFSIGDSNRISTASRYMMPLTPHFSRQHDKQFSPRDDTKDS